METSTEEKRPCGVNKRYGPEATRTLRDFSMWAMHRGGSSFRAVADAYGVSYTLAYQRVHKIMRRFRHPYLRRLLGEEQ